MNTIYQYLKRGPLLVGEVRGAVAEVGKKFDKSDKNAPPIIFGVVKVNVELLSDGSPVVVSIYPGQGEDAGKFLESLGLKRGAVVAFMVGKSEFKDGVRKVVAQSTGVFVLGEELERSLRAA